MSLQSLKQACLRTGKSLGLFQLASNSDLRNSRVLVLGYHGIALDDEHLWDPALFLSRDRFRSQMEALRRNHCTVLSLDRAFERIQTGTIPERTVVLTFDDGTYDFFKVAAPILREFGYPVTLYLTTYYVDHQYPVTPGIWKYLLWKASGSMVSARDLLGRDVVFNLSNECGRSEALSQICACAKAEKLTGAQKNELTARLAQLLGLDYQKLHHSRILHCLNPDEVQELAQDGVSVQMHTHRHVTPRGCKAYLDEIELNRERITAMTGESPVHFCYPNGIHTRECLKWLRDVNVKSAATCDAGLFSREHDPMLMPRVVVDSGATELAFESWLVGFGAILSYLHRTYPGQLVTHN